MIATHHWGACPVCDMQIVPGDTFVCIDGDFMHKGCASLALVERRDLLTIRDIESIGKRIETQTAADGYPAINPAYGEQLTLAL